MSRAVQRGSLAHLGGQERTRGGGKCRPHRALRALSAQILNALPSQLGANRNLRLTVIHTNLYNLDNIMLTARL